MNKSSSLNPKRFRPRRWPEVKKAPSKIGAEFGGPERTGEILMNPVVDIDELVSALRESLPDASAAVRLMGGQYLRGYHLGVMPICLGDLHPVASSDSLDQAVLSRSQAVFYAEKDRGAGRGYAEDVATNQAIRAAVLHYVTVTAKPQPLKPKPLELDPEAVARRDAFLQAAAYHDAIVASWKEASDQAQADYKASGEDKDLSAWEAASANAANHFDFANDMRRMAEGVKPRNAPMEFAEETQMGTWSGRLKNLKAAHEVTARAGA